MLKPLSDFNPLGDVGLCIEPIRGLRVDGNSSLQRGKKEERKQDQNSTDNRQHTRFNDTLMLTDGVVMHDLTVMVGLTWFPMNRL